MNLPVFINRHRLFVDMILIAIGSTIMALAYPMFLIPLRIVPGGVSGVSIIIHYLTNLPVGITTFILNIPLLAAGWLLIGRTFAFRTIIGMALSNLLIDFFTYIIKIPQITENFLLGAVFGGLMLGVGLGTTFLGNASTGGTDVIGQIVKKYTNYSTGMGIMIVDFFIISLAGIVFKSFEASLYGYLALFLSSIVIDRVLEGSDYARGVFIISDKKNLIKEFIFLYLGKGATEFYGKTGFKEEETSILFTAINRKQLPLLKRNIKKIDPNAFVVVTNIYEIIGSGFLPRNIVENSESV